MTSRRSVLKALAAILAVFHLAPDARAALLPELPGFVPLDDVLRVFADRGESPVRADNLESALNRVMLLKRGRTVYLPGKDGVPAPTNLLQGYDTFSHDELMNGRIMVKSPVPASGFLVASHDAVEMLRSYSWQLG